MKLYTEEQVRDAIKMADKYRHVSSSEEAEIISILEPIELLSDDEVCNKAEEIAHNYFDMHNTNHYQGLEEGAKRMAKWVIEQIKQQANGK